MRRYPAIIPAIDLIDGKCVRLVQGKFDSSTVYDQDPLDIALRFEGHGIQRLHLVDLDGAREKKVINHRVLEKIATKTSLEIDFSGGLASDEDVRIAWNSGAHMLCVGSIAVKNEALFLDWLCEYGAEKIILAADVRDEVVVISGWEEETPLTVQELVERYLEAGLRKCMTTDVGRDGMLSGPACDRYTQLINDIPKIEWIASGGVSNVSDVEKLIEIGVAGIVIGKALYEARISLADLGRFISC